MFTRTLKTKSIISLMASPLFKKHILPDCKKGDVFPAIRNNRIDFYYHSDKLFSFDGEFSTHIKYASVLNHKNDYINEKELFNAEVIPDFTSGYKRIKENCALHAGVEAEHVYQLVRRFSYLKLADIVILDTEVSFKASDDNPDSTRRQDRIDLLFYDIKNCLLRFYEAKHFSNPELWSEEGSVPLVAKQVARYNKQIERSREEILSAYGEYIEIVNRLFDLDYPAPVDITPDTCLIVFGFDKDQREGRLKKLLINDGSLEGIRHSIFGKPITVDMKTLWNI